MSERAAPGNAGAPLTGAGFAALTREITSLRWWLSLVAGICWIIVAIAILQFDETSGQDRRPLSVGFHVPLRLLPEPGAGRCADPHAPGVWVTFGVMLVIAGLASLADPEDTFAGLADMLGFLFLLVGLSWIVRAFLEQAVNRLWWVGLISGVLMTVLSFWTAGQLFAAKA